eukprot:gene50680-67847_t
MLMGLVTKNAILLVDFANQARRAGVERNAALFEAAHVRLRPILMTTLAMVFGMIPLALGLSEGSEQRAPMGQAVIGGIITSSILTLVVVPVIYTWLDDFAAWGRRRFGIGATDDDDAPAPKQPGTSMTMNLEQARFNMIEQQIRTWDVLNTEVLKTLVDVRREEFVHIAYRSLAFVETEIPLPSGENMLSPKFEARVLQEIKLAKHETVLEIGTGSGYMAALLAHHARHVTTVDIEPELQALATRNLAAYGVTNVSVESGDGARGWTDKAALFDVIVLSGS